MDLLDWGVRWFGARKKSLRAIVSRRVGALLNLHKPCMVVARGRTSYSAAANRRFAKIVRDKRFVDSGRIITTAGLSSGLDGALHLVDRFDGHGWAQFVARLIEYNWQPDSTYAAASLADRHLIAITGLLIFEMGGKPVSYTRSTADWEVVASFDGAGGAEIISRIDASLNGKKDRWSKLLCKKCADELWRYKDDEGKSWLTTISTSTGPSNVIVSVKIKAE
jgi:hypothetical protein